MSERGTLLQEIQQQKPFHSLSQEATLGLLRTTDLIRRQFDAVLGPHGITQQQYNVLRILRGARSEGLPTLAIAERMVERAPGITRLIDRLLKKSLVRRERASCDRRQVVCHVTELGLNLLADLEEPMNALDARCLAMLSPEEQSTLIHLLDRVRAGKSSS